MNIRQIINEEIKHVIAEGNGYAGYNSYNPYQPYNYMQYTPKQYPVKPYQTYDEKDTKPNVYYHTNNAPDLKWNNSTKQIEDKESYPVPENQNYTSVARPYNANGPVNVDNVWRPYHKQVNPDNNLSNDEQARRLRNRRIDNIYQPNSSKPNAPYMPDIERINNQLYAYNPPKEVQLNNTEQGGAQSIYRYNNPNNPNMSVYDNYYNKQHQKTQQDNEKASRKINRQQRRGYNPDMKEQQPIPEPVEQPVPSQNYQNNQELEPNYDLRKYQRDYAKILKNNERDNRRASRKINRQQRRGYNPDMKEQQPLVEPSSQNNLYNPNNNYHPYMQSQSEQPSQNTYPSKPVPNAYESDIQPTQQYDNSNEQEPVINRNNPDSNRFSKYKTPTPDYWGTLNNQIPQNIEDYQSGPNMNDQYDNVYTDL